MAYDWLMKSKWAGLTMATTYVELDTTNNLIGAKLIYTDSQWKPEIEES